MIDPSVIETIEKASVGRWKSGGESDDRKGWVVFNAPDHFAFMEVVVRMSGDEKDSPECVERMQAIALLFKHAEEFIASYKRMKELEAALQDLYSAMPKDTVTQALLNAQKLL